MFSQLSEQVKKSSQPVSDLFAANVKALQAVSNYQASFVSGVLGDTMKLMQTVGQQTETKDLLAAQSVYVESVRERLTVTSKNTFSTFNAVSQQFADTMRTSFENTGVEAIKPIAAESAKPVVAKPVVAKPVVVKKAAVTKKTAVSKKAKAAPVKKAPITSAPSANNTPVKKATTSATVTSATTKTAAPKPVAASKVVKEKPATVNKAATPAPKLSAVNAQETPKAAVKKDNITASEKNAVKA